ncbi:hypothetical protein [Mycobacterium sp. AZCC_0083]|uniref:hypothetical protein n=1 Tax=Mycobacterium sp. AZCC_0083 TaxID=2735882 RepID=UPI00160FB798|nr:hypothetical protein [Mycobacterium sp. AZCC_0083]MBB5167572.1 hypothetical protein [Mycobacterium sp. AZCC_0083]
MADRSLPGRLDSALAGERVLGGGHWAQDGPHPAAPAGAGQAQQSLEQRAGAGAAGAAADDVAFSLGRAEPSFGSPLYLPPFDEGAKSLNDRQTARVSRIAADVVEHAASRYAQGRSGLVLHAEGGGNGGVFSKGRRPSA